MRRRIAATVLAASAAALILAACGGGSSTAGSMGSDEALSTADAVTIGDFAYSPPDLTVSSGTTVTFTNRDSTPHTATATGGGFDTGSIAKGRSAAVKLQDPGTFTYVCSFHPFMHGTVTVK